MVELNIDDLTKVYGDDALAVENLDLRVNDGEFLVLVGPSGCGKSTTLRCVAGLETVTSGAIFLGEREITNEKPKDRDIAMVFQNYALYPQMSVEENLAFGLRMAEGLSGDIVDEKVEETAELLGIEDLLDSMPSELSGGQKQRVALGRAIVRDPEVFLMDEPLSNLDAKLRTQMRTELQNLQKELDVTTVYVTHDQTEAMTMGDRIAIIDQGKLQQVGTPIECYYEPKNQFVAGFIGSPSMNFFDVRYDNKLIHDGFSIYPPEEMSESDHINNITLGIRPEDIRVTASEGDNTIEATVDVVETLGNISYIYLNTKSDQFVATMDVSLPIKEGQQIYAHIPKEKMHIFDESGQSIINGKRPERDEGKIPDQIEN